MNNIKDVTLGARGFRVTVMAPRQQLHLIRRISTLLGPMFGPAMALLDETVEKRAALATVAAAMPELAEVFSTMPDAQLDYVMDLALANCSVLDVDGKYHPVYAPNPRGSALRMYADIDLGTELQLVAEVVKANSSGFFELLSGAGASLLSAPAGQVPADPN